jgi:hypothetical protein
MNENQIRMVVSTIHGDHGLHMGHHNDSSLGQPRPMGRYPSPTARACSLALSYYLLYLRILLARKAFYTR